MGDWPVASQDGNKVLISTASEESIGADYATLVGLALRNSQSWNVANTALFVPFVVNQKLLLQLLWCFNGGTVSGNVDIGVYTMGQQRIVSSGSTAQAGVNAIQSFDVTDTSLDPGVYYFALAFNNTVSVSSGGGTAHMPNQAVGMLKMATAFPLPATATFAALALADAWRIPLMGLAARTLV